MSAKMYCFYTILRKICLYICIFSSMRYCLKHHHHIKGWTSSFIALLAHNMFFEDITEHFPVDYGIQDFQRVSDFTNFFHSVFFVKEKLSYMRLTPKEYNEFIVYWLPIMQENEYNLVSFQMKNYDDSAKLNITLEPDSIIRLYKWRYDCLSHYFNALFLFFSGLSRNL